jgi:hypothetical protein
MPLLEDDLRDKLIRFAKALIDQQQAQVIVPAQQPEAGFWFGGGNMVEDQDGTLLVVGRFRDAGDSRTGVAAGRRGWELAVFRSRDGGRSFEKALRLGKSDLDVGNRRVLSIEGSALRRTADGWELFVSTEKDGVGYPPGFESYLKPGTGVWSIERLAAANLEGLRDAPRETVLASQDPRFVHVKDPFLYEEPDGGLTLLFCSHPFCWTSSNTGHARRLADGSDGSDGSDGADGAAFGEPVFDFFPRGFTWDVAMTRGTCVFDVPQVGAFRGRRTALVFYDGGECVRNHDEHGAAVTRPRGYSCEELGGAAYLVDGRLDRIERLSVHEPMFISPHGNRTSRYVDVLATRDGLLATWQQSQPDRSQPLVSHLLPWQAVHDLLE